VSTRHERGALAIVLHTHMPYVEGFGTWPFGEEWLWEAVVGSYLAALVTRISRGSWNAHGATTTARWRP